MRREWQFIDEICSRQDVILFITNYEIVDSAGDGNMDAGNILKPAWLRGELQMMVGATTQWIPYHRRMLRRMQPALRWDYELICGGNDYHPQRNSENTKTTHHDRVLARRGYWSVALLSNRYIQDRFLPDKAIDLSDEAGSKMNLTLNFVDPKVIDQRLIEYENLKAQANPWFSISRESSLLRPDCRAQGTQQTSVLDKDTPDY